MVNNNIHCRFVCTNYFSFKSKIARLKVLCGIFINNSLINLSEGKGSLLSFLKTRGWATSLSAGVGDDGIYRSSIAYVFVMSIHLTDSGIEKVISFC